ncbi:MAG TPA: VOC family protein [candidate division Zixibacteria bacterium]|nr:VOC family protein [candidate division Zixibacteria bacterium]
MTSTAGNDRITPREFQEAEGTGDWRVLGDGANAFFASSSFAASARLVQAIAELPGVGDHPPAVDIRVGGVTVRLVTLVPDYMGMTKRDVDLARRISEAARALGLSPDPTRLQYLLVIPGAPEIRQVMPFWQAALGYRPRPDSPGEDLVDPQDRGPGFWFEQMEEPRTDGGGAIHLAVWVPRAQAEARVQAALAAGGRLVRDAYAPAWWTLADAAGNELDIATISGREG